MLTSCYRVNVFDERCREREDHTGGAREERARASLQQRMAKAEASGIPELRAFVVKLRQDMEAVMAAMVTGPQRTWEAETLLP